MGAINSRARYIVIVGPDGSGKTTVADGVSMRLRERVKVVRCDFSFGILPRISDVLRRRQSIRGSKEGEFLSGMATPLSALKATLVGIWYGVDHLLGHMAVRSAERRGAVLVFARSYHDFMYQRAYERIPTVFVRFFLAVGPKPDIIACPHRAPEIIQATKPELTVEEIRRQYQRIDSRLGQSRGFLSIDASGGIDSTIAKVLAGAMIEGS